MNVFFLNNFEMYTLSFSLSKKKLSSDLTDATYLCNLFLLVLLMFFCYHLILVYLFLYCSYFFYFRHLPMALCYTVLTLNNFK